MRCTAISMSKFSFLLPVMVLLVAFGAAMAQSPTYKMGRTPTDAELRAWDHAVGPDGKELPAGSGTAVEGAKIYAAKCAFCHGVNARAIRPRTRVWREALARSTPLTPYEAPGAICRMRRRFGTSSTAPCPVDAEGTLTPSEVYAVTAFILFKNGIIKETDVLDKKSLVEVQMPNRRWIFSRPPTIISRIRTTLGCPIGIK